MLNTARIRLELLRLDVVYLLASEDRFNRAQIPVFIHSS